MTEGELMTLHLIGLYNPVTLCCCATQTIPLPQRDIWSVIDDSYKAVTACHIYDPSESDTRPATIDSRQIHQYEISIRASNIDNYQGYT